MSASVAMSPSPLKSAEPQASQQSPATHAKNASMSASVAASPSWLKSIEPQLNAPSMLAARAADSPLTHAPPERIATIPENWYDLFHTGLCPAAVGDSATSQ